MMGGLQTVAGSFVPGFGNQRTANPQTPNSDDDLIKQIKENIRRRNANRGMGINADVYDQYSMTA
jgi:hypothetical protein